MSSPQKFNPGKVSDSVKGAKANPLKSKEPLAESYADKRFSQIVSSIRKISCIGEHSGLCLLASIKKIRQSSKDPDVDMDNLHNIFSAVECDLDPRAKFYINFYNALFEKSNIDQRWISLDFFADLRETLNFIEKHASGDALFDSRDVLVSLASNPKFQPYLLGASSEISYYARGYGIYFGLRMLDSLVSNPRFEDSWLEDDAVPTICHFADEINSYRLGERKFDFADGLCSKISCLLFAFDRPIFKTLLDQHIISQWCR